MKTPPFARKSQEAWRLPPDAVAVAEARSEMEDEVIGV
jgi:hypothetical protein